IDTILPALRIRACTARREDAIGTDETALDEATCAAVAGVRRAYVAHAVSRLFRVGDKGNSPKFELTISVIALIQRDAIAVVKDEMGGGRPAALHEQVFRGDT